MNGRDIAAVGSQVEAVAGTVAELRLARLQREAEVLAALNHPNIAAIYGLERTPDFTARVMELVEGEDLSQRIARGAIPIDDAYCLDSYPGESCIPRPARMWRRTHERLQRRLLDAEDVELCETTKALARLRKADDRRPAWGRARTRRARRRARR